MSKVKHFHPLDKELSWLAFNDRVLTEATDLERSILNRFKYVGIASSNLDEFLRVQVASLRTEITTSSNKQNVSANKTLLRKVMNRVREQQNSLERIVKQVVAEMPEHGVELLEELSSLSEDQLRWLEKHYHEQVRGGMNIITNCSESNLRQVIESDKIYLACLAEIASDTRLVLLEVPADRCGRFVVLPKEKKGLQVLWLDDVIRHFLADTLFTANQNLTACTIKLSRDADYDAEQESYKQQIVGKGLDRSKIGNFVRLIIDRSRTEQLNKACLEVLPDLDEDSVVLGGKYHNLKDFGDFPKLEELDQTDKFWGAKLPLTHKVFSQPGRKLISITEKDQLLITPYQSFAAVTNTLLEASIDPSVTQISHTLYRVAPNSKVVDALINARINGKKVKVVVETKARFDEDRNIQVEKLLRANDVQVVTKTPFKVHAKYCLIERNDAKDVSIISTGNANEVTADVYSDLYYFTASEPVADDLRMLTDLLFSEQYVAQFNTLLISPLGLKEKLLELIEQQIAVAKDTGEGFIMAKMNNFTDSDVAEAIHKALIANVKVYLVVRGMFIMDPALPLYEGRLKVVSVIDHFLEHARVWVFGKAELRKVFLSSADWMPRNFKKRIEIAFEVTNNTFADELEELVHINLQDTSKARVHDTRGLNLNNSEPAFSCDRLGGAITHEVRTQIEIFTRLQDVGKLSLGKSLGKD